MTNHLSRYGQVADILARHGLGIVVGMAGLERWLPFHDGLLGHDRRETPYTNPEHLRLALEQLGPTFVKLGQVLSTRPDLLPSEYVAELAVLQDSAPPIPGHLVTELIAQELGVAAEEAFASFDVVPLASASIGQAHAARLADGTDVVVKVRRPGARQQIETDLEILQNLATRASQHWEAAADYDLPGIAEEFSQTLRAELDYLAEGRNAERFAANFASDESVHIPRVVWETTTSRVLTLERIRGVKVSDLDALDAAGVDRRALAVRAAGTIVKMIFEDEFFHADPHPGNLLIESGGKIGLIDFGMVGEIDEVLRDQLAVLLLALTRGSPSKVSAALADMSVGHGSVDRVKLSADLVPVVKLYQGHSLSELPLGKLISELLSVVSRHRLQLPREMALLFKMVMMAEGMGVLLDPEFQLAGVLRPYVQRLASERFSAAAFARGIARTGADAAELAAQIPDLLQRLREMLEAGGPELHLRAAELEPLVGRMESVGRHLVAATLAAAFIRGVGDLISSDNERLRSWQRPLLGAGLGAIGTLGGYLAWTARNRRPLIRRHAYERHRRSTSPPGGLGLSGTTPNDRPEP